MFVIPEYMKFKLLAFLLPAVAISSCVDIPDFSDVPTIYYNGITQYTEIDTLEAGTPNERVQENEVVVLTIDFEDKTGDLGLSDAERQDSLKVQAYIKVPGWGLPANFELITMRKLPNGSWEEGITVGDRFKFFPILSPDGKPGPIKGKLDLYIDFPKTPSSVLETRRYKVRIIDRAFHISNQVEVSEEDAVVVPVLPR
jgi:hypothetical protein